jgi:hypothetical protein
MDRIRETAEGQISKMVMAHLLRTNVVATL